MTLQAPRDLDKQMLGDRVLLTGADDTIAQLYNGGRQMCRQLSERTGLSQWLDRDRMFATTSGDRTGLAVGHDADRSLTLRDSVGPRSPGNRQLVEKLTQLSGRRSGDRPAQLLGDQRQIEQVDKRRLQRCADVLTHPLPKRRMAQELLRVLGVRARGVTVCDLTVVIGPLVG